MTTSDSPGLPADAGTASWRLRGRRLLLVATPLLLGGALWFHPHAGPDVHDALAPVADAWLLVHVLLLPLFGLLGVCLFVLLRGYTGPVATIGRIGTAVYLVGYIAFEAIVGIATGLLTRAAQPLPPDQQAGAGAVIEALATEPLVAALALLGTAGAIVAVVAIGICLRRTGAPLAPVLLLAGVPFTVIAHGGTPVDTVGMLAFFVGVVWLEFGWQRADDRPVEPA